MPKYVELSSRAIIGRFYETFAAAPKIEVVNAISGEPFPSDQASEEYAWLGASPSLREWISGRHAKSFLQSNYVIKNKKYEFTIRIELDDIRRDKTGQIMIRIDEAAFNAGDPHWWDLLCQLIKAGEATVCYDGHYFFDTNHSEGDSGTQSNLISIDISGLSTGVHGAAATAPSAGEASICIQRAVQAIYGFKNDQGKAFNKIAKQFKLVAGTCLMEPISTALTQQFLATGEQNNLVGNRLYNVTAEFDPDLDSLTDRFDVYRIDGRVKPFIRQEERALQTKMKAEGSEFEFDEDAWEFGGDCSHNVGYGLWQHACRVIMY